MIRIPLSISWSFLGLKTTFNRVMFLWFQKLLVDATGSHMKALSNFAKYMKTKVKKTFPSIYLPFLTLYLSLSSLLLSISHPSWQWPTHFHVAGCHISEGMTIKASHLTLDTYKVLHVCSLAYKWELRVSLAIGVTTFSH